MAVRIKTYNIKLGLIILSLLFCGIPAKSQTNYLYKRISVNIVDLPLDKALEEIAEKGEFTFAYNSRHFNEERKVSLQMENKTVSKTLNKLFDNSVKYKVVGSHVIL